MTDWGTLYRDNLDALTELVSGLSGDELGTVVPATPAWRVIDVVAHLAGVASDSTDDDPSALDGAPGAAWTAKHVGARVGRSSTEMLAELASHADAVADAAADAAAPAIVWDLVVHHCDLLEALDRAPAATSLWQAVLDTTCPPQMRAGLDASAYELFRGRFSRRSRSQLAGWGMATEQIEEFGIFGARDDDQPVPRIG